MTEATLPTGTRPAPPVAVVLAGIRVVTPSGVYPGPLRISGGIVDGGAPRPGDRVVRLEGHLVLPGLLNAHDHLPLNAFPEVPDLGTFGNAADWIDALRPVLDSIPFRAARAIDPEVRARHGALKNLLAGVTTVAHHDPWLDPMGGADFPVRVLSPYGWCHSPRLAGRYGPGLEESHAMTPAGARWFIHLAEGTDGEARGEVTLLDRRGLLGLETVAVHGVGFSEKDVARFLAAGSSLVWCPSSNLKILGKTLDPGPVARAGRLALGTDSRLSGSRDLLDELRAARDASQLPAAALLGLVTTNAGEVLGLRGAGALEPGSPADLVVLRDPGGDPCEAILGTRRADLRAVVTGGVPRVADTDLLTWLSAAGAAPRPARLDGAAKLVDGRIFAGEAAALEPGLTLS